jgi:hypothetical protein
MAATKEGPLADPVTGEEVPAAAKDEEHAEGPRASSPTISSRRGEQEANDYEVIDLRGNVLGMGASRKAAIAEALKADVSASGPQGEFRLIAKTSGVDIQAARLRPGPNGWTNENRRYVDGQGRDLGKSTLANAVAKVLEGLEPGHLGTIFPANKDGAAEENSRAVVEIDQGSELVA